MRHIHLVLLLVAVTLAGSPAQSVLAQSVPIVRVERGGGGIVRVVYNLGGGADSTFNISIEASNDGGRTFAIRPAAVRGDVGANVRPGMGRAIEWDSSKDVDDLQMDRFVFRIVATSNAPPASAQLTIVVTPSGARVTVDGQIRGTAPVTLTDITPGPHSVVVSQNGFLDNRREITLASGATETVSIQMTRVAPTAPSNQRPAASGSKGGLPKWLIPVASGGAVAAGLAAKRGGGGGGGGGGSSSVPLAISTSPDGTGIRDVTTYTFQASGPTNTTLTWNFGDGTSASGPSVTHVYATEGTFVVTLQAAVGGVQQSATTTVTVGNLTGRWRNPSNSNGITTTLVLVQQGTALTGTYLMEYAPVLTCTNCGTPNTTEPWRLSGSITSPRGVLINQLDQCLRELTATVSGDLRTIVGTGVNLRTSCGGTYTATYQRQ